MCVCCCWCCVWCVCCCRCCCRLCLAGWLNLSSTRLLIRVGSAASRVNRRRGADPHAARTLTLGTLEENRMLARVLLLWCTACSPILLIAESPNWFVAVAAIGVFAAVLAFRLLSLQPAPKGAAEPFRNIVIAHRGGQIVHDSASDDEPEPVFPENSLAAYRWSVPTCAEHGGMQNWCGCIAHSNAHCHVLRFLCCGCCCSCCATVRAAVSQGCLFAVRRRGCDRIGCLAFEGWSPHGQPRC